MSEVRQFVSQVIIDADIQSVWSAITSRGEVLDHFFGSVMHADRLEPGATLQMRSPNNKFVGVVGEILECDPPYRFAHTFRFTHLDDPPCRVTYELKTVPEGTEFTLISEDVPVGTKTEKQMAQGGPFITDVLKSVMETGRPAFGKRMILRIIRLTGWMTPSRCRVEEWPMDS